MFRKALKTLSIAFIFDGQIKVPLHFREYYVSLELLKRGHEVLWLKKSETGNYSFKHSIPSEYFHIGKNRNLLFSMVQMGHFLKKKGINAIWINGWCERYAKALLLKILVLKCMGFKLIYDPIDPIYEYNQAMGEKTPSLKLKYLMSIIYHLCDVTFVVTENLRDLLIRNGAPAEKLYVAYWGSNSELFGINSELKDLKEELGLEGRVVVGWLGTMSPFKGIEEILVPLIRKLNSSVKNLYFLIGGEGRLKEKLLALKEEIADSLILIGKLPYSAAPAFTKSLDIYLIPINTDTDFGRSIRPVKLFDALISGIPVVISKTDATQALAKTFCNVFLADNTVDDFYRAVTDILRRYQEVKKLCLIKAGEASKFTHQVISESIVDTLELAL